MEKKNVLTNEKDIRNYIFDELKMKTGSSIDLSGFDTGNVVGMDKMFSGCMKLTSLNLGTFDMAKAKGTEDMLKGINPNVEIYLSVDSPSVNKILGQLMEDDILGAKVHVGDTPYAYDTATEKWDVC